jgi:hypothetical protein
VTFRNDHDYPIRLPFATAGRELIDVGEAATQLGSALDVADFLEVFDPSGRRIVLTVDDLRGTPALERTLNHRVDHEPSAVLAPKESFTLAVPAINRGMARYRLLEAGGYTIRFRYVPEWEAPGSGPGQQRACHADHHPGRSAGRARGARPGGSASAAQRRSAHCQSGEHT